MTEYDNTNRGAIWPNDRMRDGKQDPQFTGTLNVDGAEYWVSAWKRKADAKPGAPSLSFTVNPKHTNLAARNPQPQPAPQPAPQEEDFSDSIPF